MASATRIACAESIAFLHLIHSVPAQPSTNANDSPAHACKSERWTLPFERERSLTSTLAFLSSINDDPNNIPAVCVQEDSQNRSLQVLIAVNEAKAGDSRTILQELTQGFGRIFSLLPLASPAEDGVFAAIVSMCSKRILCRLRLSGRKAQNQSLKGLLLTASRSLSTGPSQLVEKIKGLVKLVDTWTKHQTPGRLNNVVQGVYDLSQMAGVSESLASISNREMDPSSRKSMLNMIRKVARYRSSARFLCRTAKKFPLVQSMKVVAVSLPETAFRTQHVETALALNSYLKNIGTLTGKQKDFGQFCRLLQCSEQQASDQFVKQTRKTLSEAKIHAEMQLVFHCEKEHYSPPPRVICSSKDACFLCNSFILMHGKFHTPRCHGRLYPGWRLPSSPEAAIFERRFVQYLQNFAQKSIRMLFSRRKKTIYPEPNESTVLTIPMTLSTLSCGTSPPENADTMGQQPLGLSVPQVVKPIGILESGSSRSDMGKVRHSPQQPCSTQSTVAVSNSQSSPSTTIAEVRPADNNYRETKDRSAGRRERVRDLRRSVVRPMPMKLNDKDLPFRHHVTINQRPIELTHGNFVFLFEFGTVQAGQVFIEQQDASYARTSAAINVLDIPTHDELKVGCSRDTSRVLISLSKSAFLSLEFFWGAS